MANARQPTESWLQAEFGLTLSVPEVGQRYELYDELGAGGAAQVYLGYDRDLDRQVAVKVLRSQRRSSREGVIRFLNEAKITARLQHPGIVPIHDIGLIDGELFFSMEKVEGRTLRDLLDERIADARQGWPLDRLIQLFAQICQIVGYAHKSGVIHRDLKPANVMIGEFNKVYVMDWGLALDRQREGALANALDQYLAQAAGTAVTETASLNRMAGTPGYMAPEQILGRSDQVDARADVFALGVIFYEILAGKHPFEGATMRDTMHAIKTRDATPIRTNVSRDLKLICMTALARQPAKRYANAGELAADVHRALNLYPVSAHRSRLWAHVVKYGRRNWIVASVAIALFVAALLIVSGRSREQRDFVQWLTRAQERLNDSREWEEQAMSLGTLIESAASPAAAAALQRTLREVRQRQLEDDVWARILLTQAVQHQPAEVPLWARNHLRTLWLKALVARVETEEWAAAHRAYGELAAHVEVATYFGWTAAELATLRRVEEALTRNPVAK